MTAQRRRRTRARWRRLHPAWAVKSVQVADPVSVPVASSFSERLAQLSGSNASKQDIFVKHFEPAGMKLPSKGQLTAFLLNLLVQVVVTAKHTPPPVGSPPAHRQWRLVSEKSRARYRAAGFVHIFSLKDDFKVFNYVGKDAANWWPPVNSEACLFDSPFGESCVRTAVQGPSGRGIFSQLEGEGEQPAQGLMAGFNQPPGKGLQPGNIFQRAKGCHTEINDLCTHCHKVGTTCIHDLVAKSEPGTALTAQSVQCTPPQASSSVASPREETPTRVDHSARPDSLGGHKRHDVGSRFGVASVHRSLVSWFMGGVGKRASATSPITPAADSLPKAIGTEQPGQGSFETSPAQHLHCDSACFLMATSLSQFSASGSPLGAAGVEQPSQGSFPTAAGMNEIWVTVADIEHDMVHERSFSEDGLWTGSIGSSHRRACLMVQVEPSHLEEGMSGIPPSPAAILTAPASSPTDRNGLEGYIDSLNPKGPTVISSSVTKSARGWVHGFAPNRTASMTQQMDDLIEQHRDTGFSWSLKDLGCYTGPLGPVKFPLDDEGKRFYAQPRRSPYHEKIVEDEKVPPLIEAGIVVEVPAAVAEPKYAANSVIAWKKDSDGVYTEKRYCHNYKPINTGLLSTAARLPRIDQLLSDVSKARFFSKVDARSGFMTLPIVPEDQPKTAFWYNRKLYMYRFMPFGLKTAPSTRRGWRELFRTQVSRIAAACT